MPEDALQRRLVRLHVQAVNQLHEHRLTVHTVRLAKFVDQELKQRDAQIKDFAKLSKNQQDMISNMKWQMFELNSMIENVEQLTKHDETIKENTGTSRELLSSLEV